LFGMHAWSLQSGWDQLFVPQILRGLAMGMMMVPLSLATLRSIAPQDVPKAAGLFNLFRQLGGSLGISVLSTLLDGRADVHRAALASGVSALEPATVSGLSRLTASLQYSGLSPEAAQAGAAAVLARSLEAHAQIAAFQDAYLVLIALFVVAIPATWWVVRRIPGS
jgi:DHA2 family multidrug resistance protein